MVVSLRTMPLPLKLETYWGCSDWLAKDNGAHYQQGFVTESEGFLSGPSLYAFVAGIYG